MFFQFQTYHEKADLRVSIYRGKSMTFTQCQGEPLNRHSSPDHLHEVFGEQGWVKELRGANVMWAVKAELEGLREGRQEARRPAQKKQF